MEGNTVSKGFKSRLGMEGACSETHEHELVLVSGKELVEVLHCDDLGDVARHVCREEGMGWSSRGGETSTRRTRGVPACASRVRPFAKDAIL